MEAKLRELFSLSAKDATHFNHKQNKIELQSCLLKEIKCKEHLLVINNYYLDSEMYLREKDFQRSIEKMKSAFYKTMGLKDVSCMKCVELFRFTIIDSLKNIKSELGKMTSGFFGNKHYMPSYILVENVLQELEKVALCSTAEQKKPKEHFIGSYLKKSVS
jgi:hypothetical protein